jgi:hypothetical protein
LSCIWDLGTFPVELPPSWGQKGFEKANWGIPQNFMIVDDDAVSFIIQEDRLGLAYMRHLSPVPARVTLSSTDLILYISGKKSLWEYPLLANDGYD